MTLYRTCSLAVFVRCRWRRTAEETISVDSTIVVDISVLMSLVEDALSPDFQSTALT